MVTIILLIMVALIVTFVLATGPWLSDKTWVRGWLLIVSVLMFMSLVREITCTDKAGLPLSVQDIGYSQYQLLSYYGTDTINALVYGKNSYAALYQETSNVPLVWAIAVPKGQWQVPAGYTGPIYITKMVFDGASRVVVTDEPPQFP